MKREWVPGRSCGQEKEFHGRGLGLGSEGIASCVAPNLRLPVAGLCRPPLARTQRTLAALHLLIVATQHRSYATLRTNATPGRTHAHAPTRHGGAPAPRICRTDAPPTRRGARDSSHSYRGPSQQRHGFVASLHHGAAATPQFRRFFVGIRRTDATDL